MDALKCRACGAALRAEDLDRRLGVVTCGHCGGIFDLTRYERADGAEAGVAARPAEPAVERAPVALPERFTVDRGAVGFRVSWRWFSPVAWFLLVFAIAWNGFLVGWYAIATGDVGPGGPMRWVMVLFPLGHVAVGLGIGYFALAKLLNTTGVEVDAHELRVTHRPLPWRAPPRLPTADVEQLYVVQRVSHGKDGATSTSWDLCAVTRENAALKLIRGLEQLEQALWLEQEIERTLQIRDRPVAGEFRGARVQT
ncbi:MAG: hypothetical protein IPM29_00070 [Planctomycetes bacterium]|nr:hypothetical protein [Planctomycetota bacterium]